VTDSGRIEAAVRPVEVGAGEGEGVAVGVGVGMGPVVRPLVGTGVGGARCSAALGAHAVAMHPIAAPTMTNRLPMAIERV
jgi:hypothetical protein